MGKYEKHGEWNCQNRWTDMLRGPVMHESVPDEYKPAV